MLVWLAEHLVKYYSGFNVFSYLTFRAIVSLLTALFISLWMGPRMIARLQKLSFGQVVRNDGPESHFSKRGTPTMGGIMILLFGAIMVVGLNTLVRAGKDLMEPRNMIIVALIIIFGVGGMQFSIGSFKLGGIGLAALTGVVLNLLLPKLINLLRQSQHRSNFIITIRLDELFIPLFNRFYLVRYQPLDDFIHQGCTCSC